MSKRKATILCNQLTGGGVIGIYRLTMNAGSDNFRESSIRGVIARLSSAGASVVIFEPTLKSDEFEGIPVVADLDEFKLRSDLIVANRMEPCLSDSADKVYTRDLYFRD